MSEVQSRGAATGGRLGSIFAQRRTEGRAALVTFHTIGFPTLDESVELACAAAAAGADVLELGVPFSDPTADGPTIARASQAALRGGATFTRVLDCAARIRERTEAPLVLFTYCNPVVVTGEEQSVARASASGIDAMLVVDLPFEEADVLLERASERAMFVVPLVAPTTSRARMRALAESRSRLFARSPSFAAQSLGRGFVYFVSMTGVTGAAGVDVAAAREGAQLVRAELGAPVVVGFGIDGGKTARAIAGPGSGVDGVVVGSELIRRIEAAESAAARERGVTSLVAELRAALDG